MIKYILAATAALTLAAPLAAAAQEAPSYAQVASTDEQIRGRIESFDGEYALTVRDERGFIDDVQLHQGTIINPTGLTLAPGMVVSIIGYNDGPVLAAAEIDTPYNIDAGMPYYGGHRWDYYDSGVTLAFFFGNSGWWHPNQFAGDYHYAGGARVYENIRVNINEYPNRGYRYGDGDWNRDVDRDFYGKRVTEPIVYRKPPVPRTVEPPIPPVAQPVRRVDFPVYHYAAPVAPAPGTGYRSNPLPGPGFRPAERYAPPAQRTGGNSYGGEKRQAPSKPSDDHTNHDDRH